MVVNYGLFRGEYSEWDESAFPVPDSSVMRTVSVLGVTFSSPRVLNPLVKCLRT